MAQSDGAPPVDYEQRFWDELGKVVSADCSAHDQIDNALRTWLDLATQCRDSFREQQRFGTATASAFASPDAVADCAHRLLQSPLFRGNEDYVRTQIVYSFLQEDEPGPLFAISSVLLLDGRSDEDTFRRMIDEGCFGRLVELINMGNGFSGATPSDDGPVLLGSRARDDDPALHQLLLELMFDMSRIERLRVEDLLQVDDSFVRSLFELIEEASDDVNDPYHYPIIRVLLVLNEQYMIASTTLATDPLSPTAPMTNRVIKMLCMHGPSFRTFGENLILLLNRETEMSVELLILKLLYLLFKTRQTYEYFYTNDLKVLLDVIIRKLLDLPEDVASLRHMYLRVLDPLLAHTQLSQTPHYKGDEVVKLLRILVGSGAAAHHFAPADDTTLRLVDRVRKIRWLAQAVAAAAALDDASASQSASEGSSSSSEAEKDQKQQQSAAAAISRRFLGISLSSSAAASAVSVVDVAAASERPGVKTPSRKAEFEAGIKDDDDESEADTTAGEKGDDEMTEAAEDSVAEAESSTTADESSEPSSHYHHRLRSHAHHGANARHHSHHHHHHPQHHHAHANGHSRSHSHDSPHAPPQQLGDVTVVIEVVSPSPPGGATPPATTITGASTPTSAAGAPHSARVVVGHPGAKKKVLPEVPRHRHGVAIVTPPSPPAPPAGFPAHAAPSPASGGGGGTAAAATLHVNGAGHVHKRLPPKTPPPRRRTRLRPVPSADALAAAAAAVELQHQHQQAAATDPGSETA